MKLLLTNAIDGIEAPAYKLLHRC